jgi:hypothetical protein
MDQKIFTVTENGFSMDGSGKVSVPACKIKADSFLDAAALLSEFLKTRVKPDAIELITPLERIDFQTLK